MNKLIYIFTLLVITISQQASAAKMLATVGGEVITSSDLDNRMNLLLKLNQGRMPDNAESRKRVLQTLVEEKLYMQQAAKEKITVSQSEISDRLKYIAETTPNLPIKETSILNQIKAQLLWAKVVNANFRSSITISDKEINEASKIIVPTKPEAKISFRQMALEESVYDAYKTIIEEKRASLSSCASLDAFAKEFGAEKPINYSARTSELNETISPIVQGLSVGKASDFIAIEGFKYLFIVCSKQQEKAPEITKGQIKDILTEKKLVIAAKNFLDSIKKKTFIEYY